MSHPVRGAWIEMSIVCASVNAGATSHPVRGAWIEIITETEFNKQISLSHPVRGAWIEIKCYRSNHTEVMRRIP